MKIALVTDTHWGVRNDSLAFLDYFEKFYSQVFFPELEKRGIKQILHLGDIVDRRKYINYVTLNRMKKVFFQPCLDAGIDVDVIVGNHDVPYKNTNEINAMGELMDYYPQVNWHSETTEWVCQDGIPHAIVPWINNGNYASSMEFMKNTPAQVVFGHFEIAGCLMDKGNMNEHGLKISDFDGFDRVFSGHFHHKSTTKNIDYLGCPYELTWSDYGDPKGFHIYDTETRELEFVKNPFNMFQKFFYTDEGKTLDEILDQDFDAASGAYIKVIKQASTNPYWFDKYMDELIKQEPIQIQVVDDHLNLDIEDEDDIVNEAEDTVTILSKYIDAMAENVPKKDLDKLMRTLYNEAIHMEV